MTQPSPDEVYLFVEDFLRTRRRLPWKTARYLCRRMREKRGWDMAPPALDDLLQARFGEGPVRYSQFPGRQSLDLLWGHLDRVGELERLWNVHMDLEELREQVGEFEELTLGDNAEWIFLSHSFLDVGAIRTLRAELGGLGYAVWIAETSIEQGESIVHCVQQGLEQSDHFVLFATRNSLGSRWVLKEAGVAERTAKRPTVVVDRSDGELAELFRLWVEEGWPADLEQRILTLIPDRPADAVGPTGLDTLLESATRHLGAGERRVILYPETEADRSTASDERWHRRLDEIF